MARSKLLLEAHLKALRLPTFLREYDKLARQCAAESLDSRSFLQQLCELELLDREQRATERRIKPGFPFWPWHGHSIHPLRSEQHVLSR